MSGNHAQLARARNVSSWKLWLSGPHIDILGAKLNWHDPGRQRGNSGLPLHRTWGSEATEIAQRTDPARLKGRAGSADLGYSGTKHPCRVMILPAFKTTPKVAWFGLLALTILLEIEPLPLEIYPPFFYSYKCFKGLLFLAVGFLTPIAFWRFNSLGKGMLVAAVSACSVELFQGFFQGHRFSFFELTLKLIIIFVGFAFALNARYDEKISIGSWKIRLTSEHFRH